MKIDNQDFIDFVENCSDEQGIEEFEQAKAIVEKRLRFCNCNGRLDALELIQVNINFTVKQAKEGGAKTSPFAFIEMRKSDRTF